MFYHLIAEFVCFFFKVGQQSANEQTIICRTSVGISANEKEEKFATNDNNNYWMLENIIWKCAILLKACSQHKQCLRY